MHLIAVTHVEAQHVRGGLGPEHIARAGAGETGHHQAINLFHLNAGLVQQRSENLAIQFENILVALVDHLGFGVGHNGRVAQTHCSDSIN